MASIFFARLVPILFCALLVALCVRPVQAEPDEPETAENSQPAIASGQATRKVPARQLPAEIVEKLLQEAIADQTGGSAGDDEPVQAGPENIVDYADFDAEEIMRAEQALLSTKAPSPAEKDAPVTAEEAVKKEPDAGSERAATQMAPSVAPGLPRRKPKKPIVRRVKHKKADGRKKLRRGSDRQKYLCRALQSCRNDFIRCKSKIKHPDQSPEWSEEKEACGAIYKKCVEKDFQSGEWFFTRWFYFQELNC